MATIVVSYLYSEVAFFNIGKNVVFGRPLVFCKLKLQCLEGKIRLAQFAALFYWVGADEWVLLGSITSVPDNFSPPPFLKDTSLCWLTVFAGTTVQFGADGFRLNVRSA